MTTGGFDGLLAIFREKRELERDLWLQPPVACPYDGTVLESGPKGELHCKFDGYIWRGEPGQF